MTYKLTGSNSLSKNHKPRSTRKEALRYEEETGRQYKDYSKHIDHERSSWNRVLVNRNVRDVYAEELGGVIEAYNAKQLAQGRGSRCKSIDGYMDEIVKGETAGNARKRPRLWNDITTQVGNMLTNEAWTVKDGKKVQPILAQITNDVYKEFVDVFEKRYPNLIITLAVVHNDEATPHLQLQYVPFCHINKRGLATQVKLCDALAEALDRIGVPYNRKKDDNVKKAFNDDLDRILESIMLSHGIERIPGEKDDIADEKQPNESVVEFRKRRRLLKADIDRNIKAGKNPLDGLDKITLPFKGGYYHERDVREIVHQLMKENAVLLEYKKTTETIERKNNEILHEQQKRQEYDFAKQKKEINDKEKQAKSALNDVLILKEKLADRDEQKRYARLSDSISKKEKELDKEIEASRNITSKAISDANSIREQAKRTADSMIEDAQREIDALYDEFGKSSAGNRQKDRIKMDLLKIRFPDVEGKLDAEAGKLMRRRRNRGLNDSNVMER